MLSLEVLKCWPIRIPRPEVERLFEQIKKAGKCIQASKRFNTQKYNGTTLAMHIEGCGSREKGHLKVEAMGSYRRGEETSGDLDILITRDPSDGKDHTRKLLRPS